MYKILIHKAHLNKLQQLKIQLFELPENVRESEKDYVFTPLSSRMLAFIGLLNKSDIEFKLLTK